MIIVYKNFFRNKMVNLSARSIRHFLPYAPIYCLSLYKENQSEYDEQEPLDDEISVIYRQTKIVFNNGKPLDHVDSAQTAGYGNMDNAKVFSEGINLVQDYFKDVNDKVLVLAEDHFFTTGAVINELIEHDFDFAYAGWDHEHDVNGSIMCLRPKRLQHLFPIDENGTHVESHLRHHLKEKVPAERLYCIQNRTGPDYKGDGMYTNSSEDMIKMLTEAGIL
jgi:hypothetical protein